MNLRSLLGWLGGVRLAGSAVSKAFRVAVGGGAAITLQAAPAVFISGSHHRRPIVFPAAGALLFSSLSVTSNSLRLTSTISRGDPSRADT